MSRFPPIAIVGHGCVLPGALGPAELWHAVVEGRDLLGPVPPGVWRVDTAKALSPQAPERSATDRGGYVQGFDAVFDPSGFACPAAELAGLDPLVLWLVHSGREALREAGLDVTPRGRCGLIAGNLSYPTASLSAYAEAVWLEREGPKPANRFSSGLPAQQAARALGLSGPAFCLDAACASSLYAVKLACDQLHDGHADLMIAAGVNRGDDLFLHMGFTALNALSPTGRSRPFNREADGLIPAEGAACVVLKRLDDAVRDSNRILGVIRGVGLSNDGRSRGFLVPDAGGQERAMAGAYAQAGFGPEAVSLLECHATGTALGDATEIASMGHVFAGLRDVPIGSLKSNLGHLIAAAGLAGMVKVIQAMAAGIRPPTLHAEAAPLDGIGASPFRLLHQAEPWEAEGPRRAGISAFGFGGNNAHLLLEEWRPAAVSVPVAVPAPPLRVAVVGLSVVTAADDFAAALAAAPTPGDAPRALDRITLDLASTRFPPADLQHALPQQLLAMKAVAQAVAGSPALPTETTGVLMGMGCDAEVARRGLGVRLADLCGPDASVDLGPPLNAAGVIGTMPNIVANRFNAQFDWRGPSYSVSAEELSGIVSLRIAARALVTGELDAAVVGAVDLSCEPVHRSALAALRPDLDMPGDAAVVLVLRRVECAEAEGEPIHAILELSATAQGEFTISGPQGTNLGASPVTRRFGHAHAASGLLHVAAAVVACRGRMKPGEGAAQPWLDAGRLRARVSVEALGGATDGLVVESGGITEPAVPPPAVRLRWFAAGSRAELCARIRRGEDGGQGPVRLAFACPAGKESDTLAGALALAEGREAAADVIHFRERPLGGGLALVFTGAAAAYGGMGRELFLSMPDVGRSVTARFPILAHAAARLYGSAGPLDAMAQLQTCALICQTHAEVSRDVLGLRPEAVMGLSSGETNALFAAGVWSDMGAMFAEIDESGIYGRHLTGDCLAASQSWGQGHAADWRNWRLLAPVGEVEAALKGLPRVSITIVNAPKDCVIGGDADACRQVIARIGAHRALPLGQDMVVHCAEMEPCAPVWRRIHSRRTTPPEGIAVYANAFGESYRPSVELCAEALTRQALERVDFPRTIRRAHDDGLRIFVEHGPRNALTRSIAATLAGREHLAVSLDHPGRAPLEQLAHVAAELFAAGQDPAMAEVARRLERRADAPPAQPLTFAAHAAPVAVVLGQPMPPAPPLPPVADLPPPDLAARCPLDEAPEPEPVVPEPEPVVADTLLAVPAAANPIARILARTAELHTGYLKTASDLHRSYLQGFGMPKLSAPSPSPRGGEGIVPPGPSALGPCPAGNPGIRQGVRHLRPAVRAAGRLRAAGPHAGAAVAAGGPRRLHHRRAGRHGAGLHRHRDGRHARQLVSAQRPHAGWARHRIRAGRPAADLLAGCRFPQPGGARLPPARLRDDLPRGRPAAGGRHAALRHPHRRPCQDGRGRAVLLPLRLPHRRPAGAVGPQWAGRLLHRPRTRQLRRRAVERRGGPAQGWRPPGPAALPVAPPLLHRRAARPLDCRPGLRLFRRGVRAGRQPPAHAGDPAGAHAPDRQRERLRTAGRPLGPGVSAGGKPCPGRRLVLCRPLQERPLHARHADGRGGGAGGGDLHGGRRLHHRARFLAVRAGAGRARPLRLPRAGDPGRRPSSGL
ncbi:hypothetical protein A6A40_18255 (plasmid) [Azospirillum humicireducens]|uniref:Ketosynthase family 3 (KS3) domain-containing protein n=1 Tax=Azospirillum humicireducens TaxID=1226968 RepID=A0A2R4VRG5_9PROT|nr:hypothetical protein A6A40_18255 [Azospirillum humicireducens]